MPEKDVEQTSKQKRMDRTGWHSSLKMYCTGKPSSRYTDEDGNAFRVKCGKIFEFPWRKMGAQSQLVRECTILLREAGWSNPATLGERVWLCPKCLESVMDARKLVKGKGSFFGGQVSIDIE